MYPFWSEATNLSVSSHNHILVQDCSNSIVNALALLRSCTKPLIYFLYQCYAAALLLLNSEHNIDAFSFYTDNKDPRIDIRAPFLRTWFNFNPSMDK